MGTFFMNSAHAEDKQLVCETNTEETIKELLSSTYLRAKKDGEKCRRSAFGHRFKYIFDTMGFNNKEYSNAVMQTHNCFKSLPNAPQGAKMSMSYKFITFRWGQGGDFPSTFNIDRETLKGGYDKKRDYQCKISEWIPRRI